jgi:hypothetical protein
MKGKNNPRLDLRQVFVYLRGLTLFLFSFAWTDPFSLLCCLYLLKSMRNLLFALLISMPVYPGVLFATLPQYRIFDPPIYLFDGELENVPEDLPWKDTLKAYANVDHFNSYEELLWFYSEELEEAWQVTEEAYYEMVKAGGRLGPASITFLYAVRLNTENENVVMLVLTRNNSKRPPAFSSPSFDAGIGAVSLIYREGRWQLIPTSREQFAYAHLYYSELKQEVTEGKARIVDQLYDAGRRGRGQSTYSNKSRKDKHKTVGLIFLLFPESQTQVTEETVTREVLPENVTISHDACGNRSGDSRWNRSDFGRSGIKKLTGICYPKGLVRVSLGPL